MSCNGCRVLRKKCSEPCSLKSCLQWIDSPRKQSNATIFLAKFFGRKDLMIFIERVHQNYRSVLFQSLLFEACGRCINPVDGALGLLRRGMWHECVYAVEMVLAQGYITLPPRDVVVQTLAESSNNMFQDSLMQRYTDARTPMKINDIRSKDENRLLNLFE